MDQTAVVVALCAALGGVALGGLALAIARAQSVDPAALRAAVESRGWRFDDRTDASRWCYRAEPSDGGWAIELTRAKGDTGSRRADQWTTAYTATEPALREGLLAVRPGAPLPREVIELSGAEFLQPILQRALAAMFGGDPGEVTRLEVVSTGDEGFDRGHAAVGSDAALGRRLLDARVREALGAWRAKGEPAMLLGVNGLRVALHGGAVTDAAGLAALAEYGEALRRALRATGVVEGA